jgi:hypothetical protein
MLEYESQTVSHRNRSRHRRCPSEIVFRFHSLSVSEVSISDEAEARQRQRLMSLAAKVSLLLVGFA